MNRQSMDDLGKLVLRVTVAGLMLLHGVAKLRKGVSGLEPMVAAKGLPEVVAYGVFIGEVIAPLLILAGLFTRPAALVLVINMVFAIWLRHMNDLGSLNAGGGWKIELQMLYLLGAVAIMLLGAGRWSARRGAHRWD